METRITLLTDSRGFDTYYLNDLYPCGYGYQETFCHLLQRSMCKSGGDYDVVHIPDHYRGGSPESNILRLSLTDPDVIFLLNGIWETLLNKGHFLEYVAARLKEFDTRSGGEIEFKYGSRSLADLFMAGQLSNSPQKYIERERRIISFFRRRRRQVIYATLPVPDPGHLNRLHYAGKYRCIPEWGECLQAINDAVKPMAENYGARILDLDSLMAENGGPAECLIDQWHFTPNFHAAIAQEIQSMLRGLESAAPADISRKNIVPGKLNTREALVYGPGERARDFIEANPGLDIEAVVSSEPDRKDFLSIPVISEKDLESARSKVLVPCLPQQELAEAETRLLKTFAPDGIIVLPEETAGIINPVIKNTPEG